MQFIAIVEQLKQGLQLVVAVWSASGDVQKKIEFRRSTDAQWFEHSGALSWPTRCVSPGSGARPRAERQCAWAGASGCPPGCNCCTANARRLAVTRPVNPHGFFSAVVWAARAREFRVPSSAAPRRALAIRSPATVILRRCSLARSEEHTSELQSRGHLVCRRLLENKNRRLT